MPKLSAVLITRNEAEMIAGCLESLGNLCDEIVVVDDDSEDETVELARRRTERVFRRRLDGFGPQKQFALKQATGEWALCIDADERLTPELRAEIARELADPRADGYEIRRQVFYLGQRLRFGGHGRDRVLRLFRRERGRFTLDPVHERVVLDGSVASLRAPMEHHTHRTVARHREKIHLYSALAAAGAFARGRRYRRWMQLRPPWEFFARFVLRLGFLDGRAGFLYAAISCQAARLRGAHLRDLERGAARPPGSDQSTRS